jgi:hypothetical protein
MVGKFGSCPVPIQWVVPIHQVVPIQWVVPTHQVVPTHLVSAGSGFGYTS